MEGLSYNPTIVLKRIEPSKLIQNYHSGKYNNLSIPETKNKVIASFIPSTSTGVYSFKDKNNSTQIIHLTNKVSPPNICLNCMCTFSDTPTGIPISIYYDENRTKLVFITQGNTCSFECAHRYIRDKTETCRKNKDPVLENSLQYLGLMYKKIYGEENKLPEPAPDFRLLEMFGGTCTHDEYKSKTHRFKQIPSVLQIAGTEKFLKTLI
jgi:hypothetical protein